MVNLQSIEQSVEAVQHQVAQRQADNDSESDVFEGFAVHGVGSLDQCEALRVNVGRDKRGSEGSDFDAVILRGVCACVHWARLLLCADVLVSADGVCHLVFSGLVGHNHSVTVSVAVLESFFLIPD